MPWTTSECGNPLWEHPKWKQWEKENLPPFVEVNLVALGGPLRGNYKKPNIPTSRLIPHPEADKYIRDWELGKRVVPGLKVKIWDVDGNEYGPCKRVVKKTKNGQQVTFKPLPRIRKLPLFG